MAEYVVFEPGVEVSGAVVLSLIEGTQSRICPALAQHGITDVTAAGWYSKQAMLDAMREFSRMADLINIGRQIPDLALWPPDVDTVEKGFKTLDMAYHINHRKGEIGYYRVEFSAERHIVVEVRNPYPCDFDYGLMYGLTRRFAPEGSAVRVEHAADKPCRQDGADACTYRISW